MILSCNSTREPLIAWATGNMLASRLRMNVTKWTDRVKKMFVNVDRLIILIAI